MGTQIYAPADSGIGLPEVPADASVTRPLQPDRELLQRERKDDIPPWLWTTSALIVLILALAFMGVLAWGLGRYARGPREPEPERARPLGAAIPGAS
jgi:hypothetical protein